MTTSTVTGVAWVVVTEGRIETKPFANREAAEVYLSFFTREQPDRSHEIVPLVLGDEADPTMKRGAARWVLVDGEGRAFLDLTYPDRDIAETTLDYAPDGWRVRSLVRADA